MSFPERIVIVKTSIFDLVKDALETVGFGEKVLNKRALPFPSYGHQRIYRMMLRELIASIVGNERGAC
jgi:hypothetical protein